MVVVLVQEIVMLALMNIGYVQILTQRDVIIWLLIPVLPSILVRE
jgi:hypothetical protein